MREFGFAGAVMSERKQVDHCPAGLLFALLGQQRLEGAGISAAWEQLIAIDQMEQRHRLLAQGMNDVMIVDDVAVLAAALRRPTAPQSQQVRGAEEAVESVIVEVNIQTVADQPRRNAIKDPSQFVAKRALEVAMGALYRAILVRDATIVARRHHAVMKRS